MITMVHATSFILVDKNGNVGKPFQSFVMPIQGVEVGFAKAMGYNVFNHF